MKFRKYFFAQDFSYYIFIPLVLAFSHVSVAREVVDLNQDWIFSGSDVFGDPYQQSVDLPHSWNGKETWNPDLNRTVSLQYSRGLNRYKKSVPIAEHWQGKRLTLHIGAANTLAT